MYLEELNKANINQMQSLIDSIFPVQTFFEKISLKVSVRKNNPFWKAVLLIFGFKDLDYWLAKSDENHEVMGSIGLYTMRKDDKEAYWVGWYCVSNKYLGQGIGSQLIDFAVNKARNDSKKYLRLYTETFPEEEKAQLVYEKKGFRLIDKIKIKGTNHFRLIRELKL